MRAYIVRPPRRRRPRCHCAREPAQPGATQCRWRNPNRRRSRSQTQNRSWNRNDAGQGVPRRMRMTHWSRDELSNLALADVIDTGYDILSQNAISSPSPRCASRRCRPCSAVDGTECSGFRRGSCRRHRATTSPRDVHGPNSRKVPRTDGLCEATNQFASDDPDPLHWPAPTSTLVQGVGSGQLQCTESALHRNHPHPPLEAAVRRDIPITARWPSGPRRQVQAHLNWL